MKRLGMLIIGILMSLILYADGIEYFEHVKSLYNQGRYDEAILGFESCKTYYSEELNVSSINEWINICQSKIDECNAVIQAKKQAEITDAKRRKEESRLDDERRAYEAKLMERIEKKLLYISSNAFLFDKEYMGMHMAIKGFISDNSEYSFTDDPEMAYWCVYVTANAYEYSFMPIDPQSNSEKGWYTSKVVAYIKVANKVTNEILYEGEIYQADGKNRSTMSYLHSANKAYGIINEKIGLKVLQKLK